MNGFLLFVLGFVCGVLFVILWLGLAMYSMAKAAARNKPKAPSTLAVMVPSNKPELH